MCTVLSFVSSLNRRRVVACSSSLFTSACISSSVADKGTPFIMHDSLFSSCGFIVSLAVEPSKAFDFHALTMCLALSSVVNCNGDLRFASLIFVWYYFLYDDWSMYVVYDFSNLVSVKRISVGKLFCKIDYDTSGGIKVG